MLKEILFRIQQEDRLPDLPRPCDVFDLAGGTSMGGYVFDDCSRLGMSDITVASLIVIMLFRLQMSVDEAIKAFASLAKGVFSERRFFHQEENSRAMQLEEAVIRIVQNSLRIGEAEARSIKLLDEGGPKWCVTMSLLLLGCLSGVC